MGYYHSWRGPDVPEDFRLIRADFERLILPLADLGCPIAGADGTGVPEITDDYIHFNGIRHCGHEQVDGPVVVFPTEFACGIDSTATSRLIDTPIMTFATKRRCDGRCCHDDFLLCKHYPGGLCKTAFKPYDVAVTAALLIAKHHWGENIEITSCGSEAQWRDAKLICQRVLGYGASFKFIRKWRPPRPLELGSEPVEFMSFEEIPGSKALDPDDPPGFEVGLRKGTLGMLRDQINQCLGPLTQSDEERLSDLSCGEVQQLALRLLKARTREELFL